MRRFENAQVGDKVYCRKNGDGEIDNIESFAGYPIRVAFPSYYGCVAHYTVDGRIYLNDIEPILFYCKGDDKYLTERPKQMVEKEFVGWVNIYKWVKLGPDDFYTVYASRSRAVSMTYGDDYITTVEVRGKYMVEV